MAEQFESPTWQVSERSGLSNNRSSETRNGSNRPSTAVAHRLLPGVRIVRLIAIFRYSAPIVRVCIPHQTRTYAIANSVRATPKSLVPQGFENSVPKPRSQEVSRKTRFKSEKTGKNGDFLFFEVRRYIRKTPQTLACSGVFVTVLDRLSPCYWRARTYANTNCLCFLMNAFGIFYRQATHAKLLLIAISIIPKLPVAMGTIGPDCVKT